MHVLVHREALLRVFQGWGEHLNDRACSNTYYVACTLVQFVSCWPQHPDDARLARAVSIPVIASGGLASMADIERLTHPDCAVLAGAISGRALYDGRIDPVAALALLKAARHEPA